MQQENNDATTMSTLFIVEELNAAGAPQRYTPIANMTNVAVFVQKLINLRNARRIYPADTAAGLAANCPDGQLCVRKLTHDDEPESVYELLRLQLFPGRVWGSTPELVREGAIRVRVLRLPPYMFVANPCASAEELRLQARLCGRAASSMNGKPRARKAAAKKTEAADAAPEETPAKQPDTPVDQEAPANDTAAADSACGLAPNTPDGVAVGLDPNTTGQVNVAVGAVAL